MAYSIDTLISNLSSRSSAYGNAVASLSNQFVSWAGDTARPDERGPVDAQLDYIDPATIDKYHDRFDLQPIDSNDAARRVGNFTEPFIDMLEDTPADVDELTGDLKDQMSRIADDLGLITMAPDDFEPQSILEMFNIDREKFLEESERWFDKYLEAYSPVTPANITKANGVLGDMLDGLGLPPVILENIWDQARDQVTTEAQTLEAQAFAEFAARGYAKPPGALAAQLQNIRYQRYNKTAAASRDIAIKQAEIIIEMQKFGVQTAMSMYNNFVGAVLGYLRAYLTSFADLYKTMYSQPLNAKVEYILGMNRMLFQGDETYLNSLRLIPDVATRGGELAALPYEVQAKLAQANTQLAGIEAQFAGIANDYGKTNLDAQLRKELAKADWTTRMDTTDLGGYYQFRTSSVGAAAGALGGYARISATALAGLNAIASSTQISF